MQYGDNLFVTNAKELYIATFLMKTPDTNEYIVEYNKHYFKGDLGLRRVSPNKCMPYEEVSIINFYDKLIKEATKKAEALAYLINNKDKQLKTYDNRIKIVEEEIKNMKLKIKKDKDNYSLLKVNIKYKHKKRIHSILQKEKGLKRLYKKKNRIDYEANYKWMADVGKYIISIKRFKNKKQELLNIFKRDK
ncbi:hypothetical protein IRP63_07245 [Clostridium botulinum]|uniref:Uncharacterized protein n=1 Tax=Clostridium botulinum C/D str. DC5 TaxID=1443128 RepID=A0A0A0IMU5_CLOBO|nr:hypothetical protein [Clostridium botulinum]KGN01954.1 hypothetical protein Z955_00710 [Clostridium botulinum C/D str. DC5]KOC55597.1 hypothetical protein ADU89_04580 [Clostridium botulinum]KOC57504.1 hypothetical protein ADU90_04705 [Clostridium botulinum]MCD3232713.1 hypothetical protein [Clostridium botulinum D/C]MCD3238575.1 hypothetical protein [Clostridium botulinum D/C]